MIKDEKIRRGGSEEEMIRLAQQGKIETILCHKESIDFEDLFSFPSQSFQPLVVLPPPPPGRVCLIEGAPGGGKSTLALHICHQWAQGASWLARFDVVVLAYLRDEAVQNAEKLTDILPASNIDIFSNVVSRIASTFGENMLFIFDGWDEFPPNLMDNSLVSMIIQQPHKLSLHRSTVIVTSRPAASGNLLKIADRRVEILGFTQHQIREYIEKSLDENSTHIQKLVQHLEEHPVIEGYCYIPLHVAILVHVFLTLKGALPTTLHELFCDLVLCCIVREHATHEGTNLHLSSLDDLPDHLKSKLNNLKVLAYNGVMQNKVVFYLRDLQQSNLPSNLSSLGLLQAVEGLTLFSKSCSYNFLHLSVQELLAAYHISQMSSDEQVRVIRKSFYLSYRCQSVLQYYSGFTKLNNPEVQKLLCCRHRTDQRLQDSLPLLHCFYEAQQPSLSQLIDLKFTTDIQLNLDVTNNPSDYLAIGYFIASLLSTSSANLPPVRLSIHCSNRTDDHCLSLLLSELSKYTVENQPTACATSRKLILLVGTDHYNSRDAVYEEYYYDEDDDNYCGGGYCLDEQLCITGQGAKRIAAHLKVSPAISVLFLEQGDIQLNEDGLFHIAEALQTNFSLVFLSLNSLNLEHTEQNGSALIKMLQVNNSLKYLSISDHVDPKILNCIFDGLQHNSGLERLVLSKTPIYFDDSDTTKSFVTMLHKNKSLTYLDLSENNAFTQKGACCIFEGLKHNTALSCLSLKNDHFYDGCQTDPATVISLSLMLQVNKSLTHLDLSKSTNFLESEICCILEGLQHNTALLKLNVSCTSITATDPVSKYLTTMLQLNKSLTHLDLSSNKKFSDSGACCIFEALQSVDTTLVNLNLSNCGMTVSAIGSLTKMLQINSSLKFLNISRNHLSDSGAQCIFECLQHNAMLIKLSLRKTCITADPDTARSFAKMIHENKSLTHLDITRNDSMSENSQELDDASSLDDTIIHADDEDNNFGMERVTQAIIWNRPQQALNVYFSCFCFHREGTCCIRRILDSLKLRTTLQTVTSNKFEGTKRIYVHGSKNDFGLPITETVKLIPDADGQFSY